MAVPAPVQKKEDEDANDDEERFELSSFNEANGH